MVMIGHGQARCSEYKYVYAMYMSYQSSCTAEKLGLPSKNSIITMFAQHASNKVAVRKVSVMFGKLASK